MLHAQVAALRCWFYGDWVPSKANPADVPTRAERAHEMPPSATWVQMVLPALEAVERNAGAWIPPCQCDSVYVPYHRCVPASGVTQQQSGAREGATKP